MALTKAQTSLYWREWAAVRRAKPDADRHAIHIDALGCDVSSKALTNCQFDQVLAEFRMISRPNSVDSQLRQLNQPRRRMLWKIQVEQRSCLALYVDDPDAYIAAVITDKFGARRQIADLSHNAPGLGRPSQLGQLLMTLAARIDGMRQEAGHTVEQMVTLSKANRAANPAARAPELAHAVDDNEPF